MCLRFLDFFETKFGASFSEHHFVNESISYPAFVNNFELYVVLLLEPENCKKTTCFVLPSATEQQSSLARIQFDTTPKLMHFNQPLQCQMLILALLN